MNKRVLLGMTLMASLAFYSCTKEIVIVQEGGEGGIETPTAQDGQVLTLQVANTGDGLTSRAGRPLLSSQAKQDINTIILYVVATSGDNNGKVVLEKTISADEWKNALAYSNASGQGKQLQISFKNSDKQKLADGNYTIYAIGYYATGANYKDIEIASAPTTTTGEGTSTPVAFPVNGLYALLNNNANPAEEIFAGQVDVTAKTDDQFGSYLEVSTEATADKKVVPALVLNRQVAGVTGYFTNLPTKVGEQIPTKIRLVASNKSNKVHFTSMVSGETDAAATSGVVTSVVNGSWSGEGKTPEAPYWNSGLTNKGYKVYEIELSEFFPQLKENKPGSDPERKYNFADLDLDGDGFVGYKDAQYYVYGKVPSSTSDWDTAYKGNVASENLESGYNEGKTKALSEFWKNANQNQTLVAGSVFAGEFIIPFLQVSGTNTLELQLVSEEQVSGQTVVHILKTWNVQIPTSDQVTTGGSLAAGITGGPWSADASTLVYSIYRNHLYSLGMKTTDIEDGVDPDPSNPDPDPKPEPDPDGGGDSEDQPEDLSKGQDLLLNVNDNWEIIHEMEID